MSGMPLKKFFFSESLWQQRDRPPPTHTHVLPWINYRFVHVRNWNTSSLLGILFCLLWQKLQLIQSEQESQTHQYLLMKSSPFINRDLISRHLLIARHVQGTLGNSEPSLSEKLTGPLQWRATTTWSRRSWVGSTSGWYRPCSGTWDLHKWPCWRIMMCMLNTSALQEGGRHLDLEGRAALMHSMRHGHRNLLWALILYKLNH